MAESKAWLALFKDRIAYDTVIFIKRLFIVGDESLFLPKGREGVVHVQLPSVRCQLQSAVARRGAGYVHIVLVVWRFGLRLGVLWRP